MGEIAVITTAGNVDWSPRKDKGCLENQRFAGLVLLSVIAIYEERNLERN